MIIKIQTGFSSQDRVLLKVISSSPALMVSLLGLPTIKERKRVILRVLRFAILIEVIFLFISFFFSLIFLAASLGSDFQSLQGCLLIYGFLALALYFFFSLFRTIRSDAKIIAAVKPIDEFEAPTATTRALQALQDYGDHNYQQSRLNPNALKQKFKLQRQQIRRFGIIICLFILPILLYCITLQPSSLHKIFSMLPLLLMLGIGLIVAPTMHKDELKFLYGSASVPFKYYPAAFKMCLGIAALLFLPCSSGLKAFSLSKNS